MTKFYLLFDGYLKPHNRETTKAIKGFRGV
jgi:hypothetical protein